MTRQEQQRVAVYTRMSQDRTGEGAGIHRQETECRALAERLGLVVSEVFADNDTSATRGAARPGFEALIAYRPSAIIAWHQDRLLRLTPDLERVIQLDVPIYTVSAGTLDLSTPAGRAVARTITAWSTYEGEQKAARQRSANAQAAAEGRPYWRRRPFGYELTGAQNPVEAAAIRGAARAVLDGDTLTMIVQEWKDQGLETPLGNPWSTVQLKRLLINERLAGLRTYNEETRPLVGVEPILTEDTWRSVVAILANPGRGSGPKTGRNPTTLLGGIAHCAACGGTVYGTKVRALQHYRCYGTCRKGLGQAERIDRDVTHWSTYLIVTPGAFVHLVSGGVDGQALTDRAAELRKQLIGWETSAAALGPMEYLRITSPLRDELAAVEAELTMAKRQGLFVGLEGLPVEAFTEETQARWVGIPLARRRAIVKDLWDEILIDPASEDYVRLVPTEHARKAMDLREKSGWEWNV